MEADRQCQHESIPQRWAFVDEWRRYSRNCGLWRTWRVLLGDGTRVDRTLREVYRGPALWERRRSWLLVGRPQAAHEETRLQRPKRDVVVCHEMARIVTVTKS
ncbi:uncharacterized protein EKO05_0007029 [Ascochyta rabiei]|uniref:uncharacterized protein n=1 Tax=Didymella rabiei TaxID=5454 RepID=UPI0021FF1C97|nr:uncharacterized protein EKO05_0007029 [Ascochyta rabiei]UPX16639.1 hypothetical protein EKO05_0007029 [Ascochyta rabiei]